MANMLFYYLIVINVVTFTVYGIDKLKAKQGSWRISEATLLILAVIGGSIGALLGMKVWHHKTMHTTVFASNRNCWQHKASIPFLNGIPAITSSILMKERPRDLHGSSIRTDKQDCQCLTEFKELAAMFTVV